MMQPNQDEEVVAGNEGSLQTLYRAIALSEDQFSLILVCCNYESLRERMVRLLRILCGIEIPELVLGETVQTLYSPIQAAFGSAQPPALMVFGLDGVRAIEQVLTSMNADREEFRKHCHFPLLLWVNDEIQPKMIRLVPDIESWLTTVEFALPTNELIDFLRHKIERIFSAVLETGASNFLSNCHLLGKRSCLEFQSALKDLQRRGIQLDSALEAGVKFVLGRDAYARDLIDDAIEHYQKSLAFWQTPREEESAGTSAESCSLQPAPYLERQGVLLFHIGLCYRRTADRVPAQKRRYWQQSRRYFQQCVDILERAGRPDLVAQFISHLGEVLQRLSAWESLEVLAHRSLQLHQMFGNSIQLAQDYAFFAKSALRHARWEDAKQQAELALQILNDVVGQTQNPELFPLLWRQVCQLFLVKAQRHLGQRQEAHNSLEEIAFEMTTAISESEPRYDPLRYIRFLEILRSLYFEEGHYRAAFWIKQQQRSIEQQYGLRAFIGAGRLQPQQPAINLAAVVESAHQGTVACEIIASGRQQDVNRLKTRISSPQHKLTVIHGQSGVGKTSIITAGLVPALKESCIRTRDALPVVLQVYNDWVSKLGRQLSDALLEIKGIQFNEPLDSPLAILELLRQNAERNLLTVLIFDQFEEFFFTNKSQSERQKFYTFLNECLNIPFVKVVLSMRQDYLHYLLECTRLTRLDAIDNDILSKETLYYLGNFTPADAKAVIQSLTQRSRFYLEPALIEQIVQDLAGESGEVRPIELQVVGAQLQAQNITTLAQYLQKGPKAKLVAEFLEEAVKDCGPENENIARMVLYFLTDENDTRPLKTRAQLADDLAAEPERLDLVLEILVQSGIVSLLKEVSVDFYQLVHDYLVSLIRQRQHPQLQAELRLTKEQLRQALSQEQQERNRAEIAEIEALSSLSQVLLLSHDQLAALVASVKAGRQLQQTHAPLDVKQRTVEILRQAISEARERNRLQGHQNWVTQLSFSPNGRLLASGSGDGTVKLWQLDGSQILSFQGHSDWVNSVSFSPDSQIIASASWDKTVKLWQLDGTVITTFRGHSERIFSVCFSPDGQTIASASEDMAVKLWQRDGTLLTTLTGHQGWVSGLSFSPDGQIIASAGTDSTVKLWQLDGTLLTTLSGHGDRVWKVSFSPDGQLLASASADKTVKLWRRDGTLLATIAGHSDWVSSVGFSPDGEILATGSWDKTVKLWQLDGTAIATFKGHTDKVNSVRFSPDGAILASAGADTTIRLWQIDLACRRNIAHLDRVMSVGFSPDGRTLATAGFDKMINLWRLDGTLLATLAGHNDWVKRVCFSPDGQILASASADRTVKLWRVDGTLLATLTGHHDWVGGVCFSPDGEILASASADRTVKLWRLDGTLLVTLRGHTDNVWSVCFSPDGKTLASASWDSTVKLWNLESLDAVEPVLTTLQGHSDRVWDVSFTPDGQILASASWDKTVKLWRLDGTLLQTFEGHRDSVLSVSFSSDGQILASAGADKTIKLWLLDGTELQTLRGHKDTVSQVSFSPDGQSLASAGADKTVKLWSLDRLEPEALDLDELLLHGCNWLSDYLRTNPNVSESERHLCEGMANET
ncbi:hypothetical protein [Microcoleus sp. FACHB-672]|uniref:WD40 domain-containing protein n=1 Tax=Microcoleus sp. FACHB-672 TaxID=2692825 RepID=UPI001682031A|nr:hypothetical protein [Microcoleus sp. FACHB-672]MBD2040764.1 hypothetical protein [Microcoleus sp. FACHB-672]